MNFGTLFKAFDAVMALRDAARRLKGDAPPPPADTSLAQAAPSPGLGGHLEARLTNVVVAALKEAFDRDHARLELERAQLDEQRRRAEEALRLEMRRQAADREIGRLRLLAGTALVGWIASVLVLGARIGELGGPARGILALGWLLLLASLGAAFSAQRRVSGRVIDAAAPVDDGSEGQTALWLLIGGLAVSAASLLIG